MTSLINMSLNLNQKKSLTKFAISQYTHYNKDINKVKAVKKNLQELSYTSFFINNSIVIIKERKFKLLTFL